MYCTIEIVQSIGINENYSIKEEVEHVFGEIKLQYPIIRDHIEHNTDLCLLCQFLWYNHKNRLRRMNK